MLTDIEMTPVASPSTTGHVPARTGNDRNPVQYQLRTGPRNPVASSDSILSDNGTDVNSEIQPAEFVYNDNGRENSGRAMNGTVEWFSV